MNRYEKKLFSYHFEAVKALPSFLLWFKKQNTLRQFDDSPSDIIPSPPSDSINSMSIK